MLPQRSRASRRRRSRSSRATAFLFVAYWTCLNLLEIFRGLACAQEPNFSILYPKSYRTQGIQEPTKHPIIFLLHDAKIVLLFSAAGYILCYSQQRFLCAPHVEDYASVPPRPEIGALLAAGLYGANVAYNVLNKRLLIAYPNPVLITSVNLGTCSLCCLAAWALRLQGPPKLSVEKLKVLIPLAALNWIGILCANISVSEVNISFTHTVKAAEPLFTAIFTLLLLGRRSTLLSWFSLVLVIAGVAVASTSEVSFTWIGLWAAMVSNISVSLRTVLSKRFIGRKDVSHPLNVMAVLQCGSFLMSVPVAWLVDKKALSLISSQTLPYLLSIGPLVWIFNVSSIMILSKTSPVTHSLLRTLRRPVLVIASIITFGTVVTPLNAAGIVLVLVGMALFKHAQDVVGGTSTRQVVHLPIRSHPSGAFGRIASDP